MNNEDFDNEYLNPNERLELVKKFELMLEDKKELFFDAGEFEELINFYLEENDLGYNDFLKLQKKALNYIYQFGLYALLNDAYRICMVTSINRDTYSINKENTRKLINLVENKIKNDIANMGD